MIFIKSPLHLSLFLFRNFRFCLVYYGVTEGRRSLQPNTAFPLGWDMTQINDLPLPTVCGRCQTGPNCEQLSINLCACNPCDNFDDLCEDNSNAAESRICTGTSDSTGNPFHLMFMQNRPDNTEKRELVG